MAEVLPVFYLHTAPDVLPVPETVTALSGSVEPHSTRVILVSVPSLQEGVGAAAHPAVVTLMISGAALQTRVVNSGETLIYNTSLYTSPSSNPPGVIYIRQLAGDDFDDRRIDILRRLNSPDFTVVGVADGVIPALIPGQKTVEVADEAMLRIPVREIARYFSSIFSSADSVIAPSIATFRNFGSGSITSYIAMPEDMHIVLSTSLAATQASLLNALQPLEQAAQWQQPINMTSTGWTVFGVLWAAFAIAFLISVGMTYGWYLAQYL